MSDRTNNNDQSLWLNLTLSLRFDLDQNRWIQLIPMPQADCYFSSIIFNRNILISDMIAEIFCYTQLILTLSQ
ncbi:unnamed protein product [Blepharisma stoltei]|uniref:Uncharacterized protein n=1 Tax=Blepharisma stoltei TaxID=1481888 RepID=A0AAU9JV13_9CILI|nr:unnamed protein product [Blepharisma stoltei]